MSKEKEDFKGRLIELKRDVEEQIFIICKAQDALRTAVKKMETMHDEIHSLYNKEFTEPLNKKASLVTERNGRGAC
ncbi:MAG: hypothetical protein ACOCQR_03605 [bacterium]